MVVCRKAMLTDGLDQVLDALGAERHHLLGRVGQGEQRRGRLVDAGVGRLRRQHHSDQERERVDVVELPLGFWVRRRKSAENGFDILGRQTCGSFRGHSRRSDSALL